MSKKNKILHFKLLINSNSIWLFKTTKLNSLHECFSKILTACLGSTLFFKKKILTSSRKRLSVALAVFEKVFINYLWRSVAYSKRNYMKTKTLILRLLENPNFNFCTNISWKVLLIQKTEKNSMKEMILKWTSVALSSCWFVVKTFQSPLCKR